MKPDNGLQMTAINAITLCVFPMIACMALAIKLSEKNNKGVER